MNHTTAVGKGFENGEHLPTGASPFTAGKDRWAAMSAAFN
jgi:hypothetical protein